MPGTRAWRIICLAVVLLFSASIATACGESEAPGSSAASPPEIISDPATIDLTIDRMGVLNDDDFAIFAAQVLDTDQTELSTQQVFQLGLRVLNSDEVPRDFQPMDSSEPRQSILRKAELEYRPPTLERDGDSLVYTFWATGAYFGDLVEITAEHTIGGDLTMTYEFLYWA